MVSGDGFDFSWFDDPLVRAMDAELDTAAFEAEAAEGNETADFLAGWNMLESGGHECFEIEAVGWADEDLRISLNLRTERCRRLDEIDAPVSLRAEANALRWKTIAQLAWRRMKEQRAAGAAWRATREQDGGGGTLPPENPGLP